MIQTIVFSTAGLILGYWLKNPLYVFAVMMFGGLVYSLFDRAREASK